MGNDRAYNKVIGRKIRRIRKLAGLTQKEFAQALRYSGPAISLIEAGRRRMDAERLRMVEELWDVPHAALVSTMDLDDEDILALQNLMRLIKRKAKGDDPSAYRSVATLLRIAVGQ